MIQTFVESCTVFWSYPYSWFGNCPTGASYLKYYLAVIHQKSL